MTFEQLKLRDVAEIVGGGTPSTKNPEFWDGDIPWITPKDLSGFEGVYISRGERSLTELGLDKSSAKMLPAQSVLYTSRAPIGYVAIAEREVATNQGFKSLVPKQGFSSEYLFYLMKASREVVLSHSSGGTFAEISASAMREVALPFPSFSQQQSIAAMLLGLDHKIQVNRATAVTLESIAQTLFRSWFVDFDPVRAKMRGEEPVGMDDVTAALFPDSMEESELGDIPAGWNWGSIGDIADVIDCLHSKKPPLVDQGRPFIQLSAISDSGILHHDKVAFISDEDYVKWTSRIEVRGGDCVITNVGRVGAVSQVPEGFTGAIGRNITAIRPIDRSMHETFLIQALKSDFLRREIQLNTDSGTVMDALNVKNIPRLRLPAAPQLVHHEFEKVTKPIQDQIHALYRESVQLAQIRDILLPRLISGQLQVPEDLVA